MDESGTSPEIPDASNLVLEYAKELTSKEPVARPVGYRTHLGREKGPMSPVVSPAHHRGFAWCSNRSESNVRKYSARGAGLDLETGCDMGSQEIIALSPPVLAGPPGFPVIPDPAGSPRGTAGLSSARFLRAEQLD